MNNEIMMNKLVDIEEEAMYKVIRLADEAGVDRDKLISTFAYALFKMAEKFSFAEFELE